MNLKKIASLMRAGVMAVSMLTACGSNGNTGNGNNGNENPDPTPATTSVVDAVNKGQSAANAVKIDFTVNSELDNALAKAVSVYGNDADENLTINNNRPVFISEVAGAITRMTGLKSVSAKDGTSGYGSTGWVDANGFLTETVDRATALKWDKDAKGKVYTLFAVVQFPAWTEEAALNMVAEKADEMIAELDAHSNVKGLKAGEKYYTYGYDGNISMVSVKNLDGTTHYYVAYVVNQTVTESTLK